MAQIIAMANQKGGTGKTTTALNLGAALKEMGKSVLLVNMDPQAILTLALGLNPEELETTIYTVLKNVVEAGEMASQQVIIPTKEGLDLMPSNIELSQADLDLVREPPGPIGANLRLEFGNVSFRQGCGILTVWTQPLSYKAIP